MTDLPRTPPRIAASLVDPLTYGEAHGLHNDFTWLRANLPVSRAEVSGFDPFWVVTKHADIAEISRQNALFHNGDRPTVLTDAASEAFVRKLTGMPHLVRSLVQMDAPDHPKYRSLTQQWFTNQSVRKLEERIRTIARAQVASMIERGGECDFVRDVAVMYPLHVIMENIIIAAAGHDTTSSSTCGAMWALCEQPGELGKLRGNPSLIPGLVEEAIRWTVPVQHFMRTAMEDYSLRGVPIAKGDWLMLCYLSGNRDEEVFAAPFAFRSDRSPNKHISFGTGAHACLGQHLARLEMRILFEELIPKLKSAELTGEPRRSASTFVGGPKTLPMRYQLN